MDQGELRALHRATQPILQRTAPTTAQSRAAITPAILDQIAWGVVLAYVANVTRPAPAAIPRQVKSGNRLPGHEEVRSTLAALQEAPSPARPAREGQGKARFTAAARRLLAANGWTSQRAAQAASEAADVLQAATRSR